MGHPEDEAIRPWFFPWSLMARLFPSGTRMLAVRQPGVPDLRVVAGLGNKDRLSVMVVNNADQPRAVRITIPGADWKDLSEYRYFENDRATDADGFPLSKGTVTGDWGRGVTIVLPSRGVVFLTTP
jgi:hypothetical protein